MTQCTCKPIGKNKLHLYPYYFEGMTIPNSCNVSFGCIYCEPNVKRNKLIILDEQIKILDSITSEECKIQSQSLKHLYLANICCKYCSKIHLGFESSI